MKNNSLAFLLLFNFFFISVVFETIAQSSEYENRYQNVMDRTEWFRTDRFGMFIHYGPYAVAARGEWVKSDENMTNEEYQPYVDAFLPSNYNPAEWAALAKKAGMNYAVMTAKHHDGFCMFDSKLTDYKITQNMPGRDFIREYLDAFRAEGLKVGLYYSLIDWHHPEYPPVGNHPMRENEKLKNEKYDWEEYLEYMHAQIEELMTNYGKIDILWLDYSFDDYQDEKWGASELIKMIRKHQPDIILNNRLVRNHGTSTANREFTGYGDFETPEQGIPDKGLVDAYGNPIPWETCLTLNNNWGYSSTDHEWKTPEMIVHALVNCVSKNGNLLLNVGPDSQGTIPQPSVEILTAVGNWMSKHHESIYGCGAVDKPKPTWGYYTQKDNVLFAHWAHPHIGHINLHLQEDLVNSVEVLTTQEPAATAANWWGNSDKGNFFINVEEPTYKTYILPDSINTVFKLVLE